MNQKMVVQSFSLLSMGSYIKFSVYSKLIDEKIKNKIKNELLVLELIFSHYNDKSELKKLTRHYKINKKYFLSEDLYKVIEFSYDLWKISEGLFDISIHPLSQQWKMAFQMKELPNKKFLEQAKKRISLENIQLKNEDKSIVFFKKGISFDLGGIAKGYILDKLARLLKSMGIKYYIIDFGGDIVFTNPPPSKKFWLAKIKTSDKAKKIKIFKEGSLVSSGYSEQHLIVNDKTYSHIINPKTGSALSNKREVSVLGHKAMIADALATTLVLMKKEKIPFFMKKYFPKYRYFIFD